LVDLFPVNRSGFPYFWAKDTKMLGIADFIVLAILVYAAIRGLWNGLFVEAASLLTLFAGLYIGVFVSQAMRGILQGYVSWSPQKTEIIAFALAFFAIALTVMLLAKVFTRLANFTGLGLFNRVLGALFGTLKMALLLGVCFHIFGILNYDEDFTDKETLADSPVYGNIYRATGYLFPSLASWVTELELRREPISAP
jgi:membrane protein required for colicin V production